MERFRVPANALYRTHTDCNLNVHHQCQEKVPPMCGADIMEVRGKLLLYVELKGNNLKVDSE